MKALRLALLAVLLVGSSFVVNQSSQSAGAAEVAAPAPSAKARQRIIPMGPSAVWIGVGCTDAELDVELTVDAVSGEHKIIGEFTRYGRLFGPAVQITVVDAEGSTTYPLDGTAVLIDTSKAVYPVDQSISIPDGVDQISVTGEVLKRYGSGVWCQSSAVDLAIGDVSVASAGYEINPESVEFAYELTGIDGAVTVSAAVTFWVGTPCVDHELVQVGASAFTLTGYLSDAICPQVLQERTEIIDLGEYGPGEHTITINGVEYSFVVDDIIIVDTVCALDVVGAASYISSPDEVVNLTGTISAVGPPGFAELDSPALLTLDATYFYTDGAGNNGAHVNSFGPDSFGDPAVADAGTTATWDFDLTFAAQGIPQPVDGALAPLDLSARLVSGFCTNPPLAENVDAPFVSAGYELDVDDVAFTYVMGPDGTTSVSAVVAFAVGTPCIWHTLAQDGETSWSLTGFWALEVCPWVIENRTETIDLGEYGPGEHTITINGVEYSFVVDDVVVVQGAPDISVITSVFPAGAVTDCPAQVPVAGLVNDVIPAAVGTDVLYCVWATNAGTADALNVVVANSFDSGVAGPTLPFGTLVPGQTAVDGFVHTTDASPQTSTANITGFDPDGVTPAIGAYTTDPAGVIPPVVDPGVDPGDPVGLAVNGVRFVYDWPQIDETIPVGAEVTFTVGTPCHEHTFTELSVLSWSLVAVPSDDVCPQVVEQRTETIFLGSFPEGDYVLTINGVEYVLALGMVYVN